MTFIGVALTVSAVFAAAAAAVFCVLYAQTRRGRKRLWWETQTGRSIMALALTITLLALGTVVRRVVACEAIGEAVLTVAYLATGAVMVWRTVMMWHANHPRVRDGVSTGGHPNPTKE